MLGRYLNSYHFRPLRTLSHLNSPNGGSNWGEGHNHFDVEITAQRWQIEQNVLTSIRKSWFDLQFVETLSSNS